MEFREFSMTDPSSVSHFDAQMPCTTRSLKSRLLCSNIHTQVMRWPARRLVFSALQPWFVRGVCVMAATMVGKVAIVTGAGRGIGKAIARALGDAGARVLMVDINPELLRSATQELADAGIEVDLKVADVASAAETVDIANMAVQRFGRIDI